MDDAVSPISSILFSRLYRSHVRVRFAWKRFEQERWPVTLSLVENTESLQDWFVPWYVRNGCEVDYNESGGSPIRLVEVPQRMGQLAATRQAVIHDIAARFAERPAVVRIDVPVFSLGAAGALVLDGNHRLSAMLLARCEIRLLVFRVAGPIDRNVLPDLAHWHGPDRGGR
jgi:hypothetical protein